MLPSHPNSYLNISVSSEASIAVNSIPASIPRASMVSIPAPSTGQGLAASAFPLSVQDLHAFLWTCHQEAQGASGSFLHSLLDPSNSLYLNPSVSPCCSLWTSCPACFGFSSCLFLPLSLGWNHTPSLVLIPQPVLPTFL